MKKILATLLLVALALALCGCGESASPAGIADQQEFLNAMAKGISTRLGHLDDSKERSPEEMSKYYVNLVQDELKQIARFDGATFSDPAFGDLAQAYIDGCKLQLLSAENYKNSNLYPSLWDAGARARNCVIVELYSRYDLPITGEEAAQYSVSGSGYTITVGTSSGTGEAKDYSDCLKVRTLPSWNEHYSNADYYHYDQVVTNDSADCALEVTISVTFYDSKGNVVGAAKETLSHLDKGETQLAQLKTDVPFARAEYKIEKAAEYTFRTSGMKDLDLKVTTPSGKVMVQATNKGETAVEFLFAYCVFYNGDDIVDIEMRSIASSSDPIEPGESQYGELSTRKSYTSYELYYQSMLAQ